MYVKPTTFDVRRKVTIDGTVYNPGDTVPPEEAAKVRSLNVLVSNKTLVASPDPYRRRTKSDHPTPTSVPQSVRQEYVDNAPPPVRQAQGEELEFEGEPDTEPLEELPAEEGSEPLDEPEPETAPKRRTRRRKEAPDADAG